MTDPKPTPPTEPNGPEPFGPIAERVLDDLAARQAEAINRLRRATATNPLFRRHTKETP